MSDRDIVDAIDELVDTQMRGGEPETGYDFDDPTFPDCPHCDETWHGLAITQRMRQMRWTGRYDPDYRYNEDDSTVLCPGSDYVGEWTPPVDSDDRILAGSIQAWEEFRQGFVELRRQLQESMFSNFGSALRDLHASETLPEPDEVSGDGYSRGGWLAPEVQFPRQIHTSATSFAWVGAVGSDPFDSAGWEPFGTIEPGRFSFRPAFTVTPEQWEEATRTDVSRELSVEFQVDPATVVAAATGPWYMQLIEQLHRRTGNVNEGQAA